MAFAHIVEWQAHDEIGRRKYLNRAERDAYLALADSLDRRSRALCRVLALTGCRVSEALALTRHQLDTDQSTLTIRTLKRRRLVFRRVHIPSDLAAELAGMPVEADGRFWTMHRTTAWRLVKKLMEQAEIQGPMATCRGLRHGFGVANAEANIPMGLTQRWMGHARLETTTIYQHVVGEEERAFAKRLWARSETAPTKD